MDNPQQPIVILCTCPAEKNVTQQPVHQQLAHALVEAGLAACVNILPEMQSIYRWQGQIENETETLLIIKSIRMRYVEIEKMILTLHPYDVPEVIMLPIEQISNGYLKWLVYNV